MSCLDLSETMATTAVVTTKIIEIKQVAKMTFLHLTSSFCRKRIPSRNISAVFESMRSEGANV